MPKTARDQIEQLATKFHAEFVPMCVQFMANPPAEEKVKDFEHRKLSETILAQVLLKLDAVETEGDQDARQRRKDLVKECQAMFSKLDSVAGKLGGT